MSKTIANHPSEKVGAWFITFLTPNAASLQPPVKATSSVLECNKSYYNRK
ncbi:hypothetical protein [Prevotella intermedia]|nr:hypothetical protein [Prevotella intermedia]